MPKRKKKTTTYLDANSSTDIVKQKDDGWNYLVDTGKAYADMKTHYELDALEKFKSNVSSMALNHIGNMSVAIYRTGLLTINQKTVRLQLLRERWNELTGGATFYVED